MAVTDKIVIARPFVLWLTGLSGAGKTTIATLFKNQLNQSAIPHYLLDGDSLRQGLCRDLGFSEADRYENCRRMAEAARLLLDAGLVVICASISPYTNLRQQLRLIFKPCEFIEVFVDAPLAICERRDPKGLYKKARRGEIVGFTGIDSVYEPPIQPDIHLTTDNNSPEDCCKKILNYLKDKHSLCD